MNVVNFILPKIARPEWKKYSKTRDQMLVIHETSESETDETWTRRGRGSAYLRSDGAEQILHRNMSMIAISPRLYQHPYWSQMLMLLARHKSHTFWRVWCQLVHVDISWLGRSHQVKMAEILCTHAYRLEHQAVSLMKENLPSHPQLEASEDYLLANKVVYSSMFG